MSEPFVELDLHRMHQSQAIREIDRALLRADNATYQIRLVHGYHGGDALKAMIPKMYRDHPKVKRIQKGDNPGVTILVLKELY